MTMIQVKLNDALSEMDDSLLQRKDAVWENDDQKIEAVEYCLLNCDGNAHVTGIAQGEGCFCEKHVHRSVHLTVKRWPEEIGADAASLT